MDNISIVILTYNRAERLRETLGALRIALSECRTHLVVIDNASTDSTGSVVAKLGNAFDPPIDYRRNEINNGIDGSIIRVWREWSELPNGGTVWFLSDDDVLYSSAVPIILDKIKKSNASMAVVKWDSDLSLLGLDTQAREFAAKAYSISFIPSFVISIPSGSFNLEVEAMGKSSYSHLAMMNLLVSSRSEIDFIDTPVGAIYPNFAWRFRYVDTFIFGFSAAARFQNKILSRAELKRLCQHSTLGWLRLWLKAKIGIYKVEESHSIKGLWDISFKHPFINFKIIAIYAMGLLPVPFLRLILARQIKQSSDVFEKRLRIAKLMEIARADPSNSFSRERFLGWLQNSLKI